MNSTLADSLVLVFTFGMSLKGWRDTGMLDREWALYEAVGPSYRRVVVVTYGDEEDDRILASLLKSDEDRERFRLVCNRSGLPLQTFCAALPTLVKEQLGGCSSALVKTNQMVGGEVAVQIADGLRRQSLVAGLVARGGYLWTRFVTYERGPHSDAANEAAARERLLCTSADMVVGSTEDMVTDLAWRYGLDPARTAVIPNYVLPCDEVLPAENRERGLLLYAGQLVRRKRVDVLIDAVARLPDDIRAGVSLEVYGEGPERKNLMAQAEKLGAPVKFFPRIPHLQLLDRMRLACAFLQASELEGHPKTVLEAMACGTPVIVAASPGLQEVVVHGGTGIKVPIDPDAFATAIGELIHDEDWREVIGASAARAVRAQFSLETVLVRELEVHRAAMRVASARQAA